MKIKKVKTLSISQARNGVKKRCQASVTSLTVIVMFEKIEKRIIDQAPDV
jgi:hypothetical protein